jgi:hypothetical protein
MLLGAGIGAGLMFLLDPEAGNRRRALIRDKMTGLRNDASWALRRKVRHLGNKVFGAVVEWRIRIRGDRADDSTLEQRVRAQIGHAVSHPGALEVSARNGHVRISGPVLAGEQEQIGRRLRGTRGVHGFELHVRAEKKAGSTPALQGESRVSRGEGHTRRERKQKTSQLAARSSA